ncbi:TonB-dependent receptor [Burkholderiaceae bacterium DAT-1]|nr:TonB-dependent receptor [Burkholderiaceae bacterium DAT-1]
MHASIKSFPSMLRPISLLICAAMATVHAEQASTRDTHDDQTRVDTIAVEAKRLPAQTSKQTLSGAEATHVPGTGGDPIRALQSLPGVVATSDGNPAPAVRGSRPEDNAYYVDSLPVGYVFHMYGNSTIHGDLVKQFDLYTGSFGPEYDDVHGGVADITLRKPKTDKLHGAISLGLLGAEGLVEGPVTENQSFYFAAKRSFFDLLVKKELESDEGIKFRLPSYTDYQGKYTWQVNAENELSFHVLGAADKINGNIPKATDTGKQEPALVGNFDDDQSSHTEAIVLDSNLNSFMRNKLSLGHMHYQQTSHTGTAADVGMKLDSTFLREQLKIQASEAHDLTLGGTFFRSSYGLNLNLLDAKCTEFEPRCDITSAPRHRFNGGIDVNYSILYVKDRWQLMPDLTAVLGLHHSIDGYLHKNYTEPRVGLEWKTSEDTVLSLGAGQHNEFPNGLQVLKDFGNPALGHMRSKSVALGMTQRLQDGWSFKSEAYYKTFSDFVIFDPVSNYRNGGSGHAKGMEFFMKKDPAGGDFSGWVSLSLSDAKRKNDLTGQSFRFEYDQPVVLNVVGQYRWSDTWQFGAKWSYHSGSLITPIIGKGKYPDGRVQPLYGELNSERLPAYHRLDLRADRKLSERMSVWFELINAYNRENVQGYTYDGDYTTRKADKGFGAMINAGFTYSF